jgi:hypothetical protein
MPIDRNILKSSFKRENFPEWICPSCKKGVLKENPETFHVYPTAKSTQDIERYGFDPDWVEENYCVVLTCNNKDCRENVVISGKGGSEEEYYIDETEEPTTRDVEKFRPIYAIPPLNIFAIPFQTPKEVTNEIIASFNLFWADQSASVNHVRRCLEEILTERGIRKYSKKNGKRISLSLHDRIIEYGKTKKDTSDKLLALKWLGNAASHPEKFTLDDVIDAYEILELVLDNIYVKREQEIERKVKIVNKTKKPIKR